MTTELNPSSSVEPSSNVDSVDTLYQSWFLDYASYVILDRAVPHIDDGLKPVQRRILHSLFEMDDGRFHKVANIIGHTMQFHPHGDAAIGDALVNIGQKNLLIDTQGNWGDPVTGDSAAAPRYIEGRLSKFALDVVFNPKTTPWQFSYDGRKKEPVTLPVKFPLLLSQGTEGIAVGLATKILSHNFIELLQASIHYLNKKKFEIFPDFLNGGLADVSKYNEGQRGGKIRVRAKIVIKDKKTLCIEEIPFGTTTTSLIESIVQAHEKGKIKIQKVEDNTAEHVDIAVHLTPGISPDRAIDALYAFTDCEVSISPNCCVIQNGKPRFISVNELLKTSTDRTVLLLKTELEMQQAELLERWHFCSLEKIFIENRIYRKIENAETFEEVIDVIDKGLKPFTKHLHRLVTKDDIIKLTEIKIKRISKYDSFKADETLKQIEKDLKQVKYHLANLITYAVQYFKDLITKYGKGRERKTELKLFDTVQAAEVALASHKLYMNRLEGFIGTSLKKEEYVCDCSDIDDVIVFRKNGTFTVTKVSSKTFVGKDIIHAGVFAKNDERTVYHFVYRDGLEGITYVKRFNVGGITRDKEYDLTQGNQDSEVLYFSVNPNGEGETVAVKLKRSKRLKTLSFEYHFADLEIKGRNTKGNILTRHAVEMITLKEKGRSTLGGQNIWFDPAIERLNTQGQGNFVGSFERGERILVAYYSGFFDLRSFDLQNKFDADIAFMKKFNPEDIITIIHYDHDKKAYFAKRFQIEPQIQSDRKVLIINEGEQNKLMAFTVSKNPVAQVTLGTKTKKGDRVQLPLAEFTELLTMKAQGKKITDEKVAEVSFIDDENADDEQAHRAIEETAQNSIPKKQMELKF